MLDRSGRVDSILSFSFSTIPISMTFSLQFCSRRMTVLLLDTVFGHVNGFSQWDVSRYDTCKGSVWLGYWDFHLLIFNINMSTTCSGEPTGLKRKVRGTWNRASSGWTQCKSIYLGQPSHTREIISGYCFKPLKFELFWYITITTWHTRVVSISDIGGHR